MFNIQDNTDMKILKPVFSTDAPTIKDALWIQPTGDGLEIKALVNGVWKSANIGGKAEVDYAAIRKYIDVQLEDM